LLNTLLKEQRAIVTDIPGTTRDTLEEYMNIHGVPLRLIDTAGIRETEDYVEKIGVTKAKEIMNNADLIILMIDSSQDLMDEDIEIIKLVKDKNVIILLNKIDIDQKININHLNRYIKNVNIIPVSIKNMDGIENLEQTIKDMFFLGNIDFNDNVYITNVRHKNALTSALDCLEDVKNSIDGGLPEDFWAIDLKNVYDYIGDVTGDSVKDDLIDQIFSQFCLGK
jgi:tRNA modification GTPase